jgi:hypothetical protein
VRPRGQAQMTLDPFGLALGTFNAFVAENEGFEVVVAFFAGVFIKGHEVSCLVASSRSAAAALAEARG